MQTLITHILKKNFVDAKEELNKALHQQSLAKLLERKVELASNLYKERQ